MKVRSIIRIAILFVLGATALILFFCEEQGENPRQFFFHVLIDKCMAIAAGIAASRLYKRWSRTDRWIKSIVK